MKKFVSKILLIETIMNGMIGSKYRVLGYDAKLQTMIKATPQIKPNLSNLKINFTRESNNIPERKPQNIYLKHIIASAEIKINFKFY